MVYIDVRDGLPTAPTLFALSEARRIARLAGASTFAVVVTPPLATTELENLSRPIAEAGADKLLLCEADAFAGPPDDAKHGRALDAASARVPPMLVLFPAGGAGIALGPPLAARLGGPFAPWCDFLITDADVPVPETAGRVQLIHFRPDGRSRRRLDPIELERPVVATIGAGRRPPAAGSLRELEIDVVVSARAVDATALETDRAPDPYASFELASILVLIGDVGTTEGSDGPEAASTEQIGVWPWVSPQTLAIGAPPGTVAARASDVPAAVLLACCPDILLKVGPSPAQTARSPRTRVVLAAVPGATDPAPDDVDVLWQFHSPMHLSGDALAALLAEMEDRG